MDTLLTNNIVRIAEDCGGTISIAVKSWGSITQDIAIQDNLQVSSASVIKLPILVEAMRRVRDGELSLAEEFEFKDELRIGGSGVIRYLHKDIVFTLDDLLTLMMIVSDNAATNIIIDLLGFDAVNTTMKNMGYRSIILQRKMMDWDTIEQGRDNFCSAREITDLLARIAEKKAVGPDQDDYILSALRRQQDVSKLGLLLPREAVLGNKTGSRHGIMHDCGIVWGPDFSYAISVFTKDAKSPGDAVIAIGRISKAVYDHFSAIAES